MKKSDKTYVHCDSCGKKTATDNAITRDFGRVTVSVDMSNLCFCTKACENEHIVLMLQTPLVSKEAKKQLVIDRPLLAKQFSIGCNLDSCPKKAHSAAADTAPAQEGDSTDGDSPRQVAENQLPIEASFLTKIKRSFGSKDYYVDLDSIAKDLARRALYYENQPSGIRANKVAIRASADAVWTNALRLMAAKGFTNKDAAEKTFRSKWRRALDSESLSKAFFAQAQMTETKPAWNDKVLAEELSVVLRRSLEESAGAGAVNDAQLEIDVRRIFRRTIELAGVAGHEFLTVFLFDLDGSRSSSSSTA